MSSADFDIVLLTPPVVYHELHAHDDPAHDEQGDTLAEPGVVLHAPAHGLRRVVWLCRDLGQRSSVSRPGSSRDSDGRARRGAETGRGPHPSNTTSRDSSDCARCAPSVTPIHPFELVRFWSATIEEGLYVFDPGALGPHCGSVTLVLYSAAGPEQGDSRVVDPKILEQIWQDFEPYRKAAAAVH